MVFGVSQQVFGLIWRLFEIFHFLRLMQFFLTWIFHHRSLNRFGTMLIVFSVLDYMILHVFSKFHIFVSYANFSIGMVLHPASDRFGTMPILSGTIENLILDVFRDFQLQHGPTIGYLWFWRFGMVHNFGMDNRIVVKLVAVERGCKTGL